MGHLNDAVAAIWGFPSRIGQAFKSTAQAVVSVDIPWSILNGGNEAKAGVVVNTDAALRCSVAFACARVLAEGIAQLPFKVYERQDDGGAKVARDHPAHLVLSRRPNAWQRSFEFRETMMYHCLFEGDAIAVIIRVKNEIRELVPIMPGSWKLVNPGTIAARYEIRDKGQLIATLKPKDIFHLRGPSWNGHTAMNPIRLMREAIGLALATEENHARLHSQGARPGGILTTESGLDDPQLERIKQSWADAHGGLSNQFKTVVLDGGMTWKALAFNGVDSEHIATRKFQVEEVCRGFRVFPQMVGSTDKASTYGSAEAFFGAHVTHSLGPWIARWEQAVDVDLLGRDSLDVAGQLFSKFSVGALLRGDTKTRTAYYHAGILDGWLTRNQVRILEEMNPIEGLDVPLEPGNMNEAGGGDDNNPPDDKDGGDDDEDE